MPATVYRRTPGVYVTELSAFPPSIVGVQTAVPAFIGYTKKAEISGKPVFMKPIKIGSMVDFVEIFGKEYDPVYQIQEVTDQPKIKNHEYDFQVVEPPAQPTTPPPYPIPNGTTKYFNLVFPTGSTKFNLYNSLRLFYANGGGNCFVVSVGTYEGTTSISKEKLLEGLGVIKEQVGPTMLVVPDAVLLAPTGGKEPGWVSADFQAVTRRMLEQSAELKDRMAILDVYGTPLATKDNYEDIITRFREDVGDAGLSYGAGYFPFLATTVIPIDDFDYTNITGVQGGTPLSEILTWQAANLYNGGYLPGADQGTKRYLAVKADIDAMATTTTEPGITKLNNNLMASLPLLKDMLRIMIAKESILPPSGAMAGIYTYNDATRGVWNAPANLTLSGVDRTTFKLNDEQQGEMNVPVNGKAVDALREFVGRGVVVWGARTLDGNSNDNRYIQVRRTLITVEQSIKLSLDKFVFAANDANTWVTVVSMISNYLQGFWSQGGLMGSTAQEAFSVQCGLGSTMTPMDVLEGYMIVQVTLQMIRPAEFIELTFKQKMEGLG